MLKNFLKNLSPTREPVAYVYVLLVAYQVIFNHMPIPDNWIQYLVELAGAAGARQLVAPLAKVKELATKLIPEVKEDVDSH